MERKAAVLVLILALILLCACRPSDALVDTVYTMDAPDTEQNDTSYIDNSRDNQEENNDLSPEKTDKSSEDPRERERQDPVPGDEPDETAAPEIIQDDNAASDFDSSSGGETGGDAETESGETPPPGDGAITVPDNAQDGEHSQTVPVQNGPRRQVENAYGELVDIPQDVESVTAVGEAALIVQMLGGGGRLAAVSASFTGEEFTGRIFADEAISETDALWRSIGDAPLSEESFQKLLQKAPQVCFEISGQRTFSDEQITRLAECGIGYVSLPALTSHSGIIRAVKIVGEVLGDAGGVNARDRAAKYISYCDSVLKKISTNGKFSPDGINYDTGGQDSSFSGGSGIYSLFISGWDAGVRYTLHDDSSISLEGTGLPVAVTGYTLSPMSYYMSIAGVANTGALKENNYSVLMPNHRYVNPIQTANKALSATGGLAYSDGVYVLTSAGGSYLGESSFPAIIAGSAAVRDGILGSPLWRDYGYVTSATGLTHGYGFLDASGQIVASTIHGEYDVLVNPCGVGSWTEGSVESILEPLWISHALVGNVSEKELRDEIAKFYDSFYRYTLSDSEINAILAGR